MNSKKHFYLFNIIYLVCFYGLSQSYHGFTDDNYNGVYGAVSNPANAVDSRHVLNVNIISGNTIAASDYTTPLIFNSKIPVTNGFDGLFFNTNFENDMQDNNQALTNIDVMLPSFVFSIGQNHSIGLLIRARGIYNYNNFSGKLSEGLTNGFGENNFSFNSTNMDATSHFWKELGLNYGTVLFDAGEHYVKAGVTLKLLQGMGATQIRAAQFAGDYNATQLEEEGTLSLTGDIKYSSYTSDPTMKFGNFLTDLSLNNIGIASDIGIVYEYRTRATRRVGIGKNGRARNKYKFKIAASLLDLGKIKYKDASEKVYTINGTVNTSDAKVNFLNALEQDGVSTNVSTPSGKLEIALPTSLQLNLDFNIIPGEGWFANLAFNKTLVESNDPYNNNRLNLISLTPRYESQKFSFYLPISHSELGGLNLGAGMRYGPFTIGSATWITDMAQSQEFGNLYFGVNIPMLQDWDHSFYAKSRKKHRVRRRRKSRR